VGELGNKLNGIVFGTGTGLIDVAGNLVTSRLVSYGFLAQATEVGADTYQVTEMLDERICPVWARRRTIRYAAASWCRPARSR
jgi:hypothetical protein